VAASRAALEFGGETRKYWLRFRLSVDVSENVVNVVVRKCSAAGKGVLVERMAAQVKPEDFLGIVALKVVQCEGEFARL
jgi:hypothetical protein